MKKLLPEGFELRTADVHDRSRWRRNQLIYSAILLMLVSALVFLPFIEFDVSTSSPGVIRSEAEPLTILASATGIIEKVFPVENAHVRKGDTLLVMACEKFNSLILKQEDLLVLRTRVEDQNYTLALLSPIDGSVRVLSGLFAGSLVQEGRPLFEIVPDSHLIAACYVSPDEIGFVKPGQEVEIQVSSFKRRVIGPLRGKVLDIGSTLDLYHGNPAVEVRCSLNEGEGIADPCQLKKGMTLLVRFRLARRSAIDLLADEVEDPQKNGI